MLQSADARPVKNAWIASWVSAQQLTEPHNLPPAPGFPNSTLRQIVQLSLGGERLRISLSNEFGDAPLTLRRVHLARATGGGSIDTASDMPLSFGGSACVTIPVGATATSDEVALSVPAFADLAITLAFDGAPPTALTGHPGSRMTSYLQRGDAVAEARLNAAQETEHWFFISEIDVLSDGGARALVTLVIRSRTAAAPPRTATIAGRTCSRGAWPRIRAQR